LKAFANKPSTVHPGKELPYVRTDLKSLPSGKPTIVWFGHSSYLVHTQGLNILVDPVFSGNASPVPFFGKSFTGTDHYAAEDFPPVDLLILTHDHYDHLDYKTILAIHGNVKKIITPLGVGTHLEYWGVDKTKITELDWWEDQSISDTVKITAAPARHFSGRGISRGKSLWVSYVLQIDGYKIFIGGDSGYDHQFNVIGKKFDGFDLAFLECGQYGKGWPLIHMMPEETVRAARNLGAAVLFPVHWAKFVLSIHPWNDPIKRLVIAAKEAGQKITMPMIGQPYVMGEEAQNAAWWEVA
jgi:L-ascorbate metabolism protein UlaG (beta-lactamase superfamily)